MLRIATIPSHPFNSDFLHARLRKMSLTKREIAWTIPIAELTSDDGSVPAMVVTWAMRVPQKLVSDQQALLVSRVLCWFMSSNRQALRKRATVAAIRMLVGRAHVACQVLEEFRAVDDPYVAERVHAVACGVALREPAGPALRELANAVYQQVFAPTPVTPHILLRDYATATLEAATYRGCLPANVTPDGFRPPFASRWPQIWTETQAHYLETDEGWNRIVASVRPQCMMPYGDFGRYVMESRIHDFAATRRNSPYSPAKRRDGFDGRIARRWVLQRVKELGWTPALFGHYEKHLPWQGRHENEATKVERLSKKYQWIALHELLGYLSDHWQMRSSWHEGPPPAFLGAWQISVRDFDPSAPLAEAADRGLSLTDDGHPMVEVAERYPSPFENVALCSRRSDWVIAKPFDFAPLIHYPASLSGGDGDWVALNGFWKWNEPEYQAHRLGAAGRLEMWVHLRSWLVGDRDVAKFLRRVRGIHFWGHGCTGVSLGDGWLGEYPWGGAFAATRSHCAQPDEWIRGVHIPHIDTACDWDARDGFIVPSPQVCDLAAFSWSGRGPTFLDRDGRVAAVQTGALGASERGPCVVRLDVLRDGLRRQGLRIVWALVGERECWDHTKWGRSPECVGGKLAQFSGVYSLTQAGLRGGITQHVVENVPRDV